MTGRPTMPHEDSDPSGEAVHERDSPGAGEPEAAPDDSAVKEAAAGEQGPEIPLWEWVAALVGLALVLGAVAVLLFEGLWGDSRPPDITVERRSVIPLQKGYLVEIEVRNQGGQTAAALTVEGELAGPDGQPETSDATFDYVPGGSRRRGGLFFTRDPRASELKLRAKGYQQP